MERLLRRGADYFAQRQWVSAKACFDSVLAEQPRHAWALLQLSYIHSLQGEYRSARACALQAHACEPDDPAVVVELAKRLRTFNEVAAINECLARLGSIAGLPIPVLLGLGSVLSYINDQDRALTLFDTAVDAAPDYPPALLGRSQVLSYFGRNVEAERDLDVAIARAPAIAHAHWLLARTRRQTAGHNHVARLRARLAGPGVDPADRVMLAFALHKELDDLGDYPAAWEALTDGCRAKRSALTYRSEQTRALMASLRDTCSATFVQSTAAVTGPTPIFIVGMHRSGTTLLERILAGHTRVTDAGELYDFTTQMRYATDHHCRGVIDATIVQRAGAVDFGAVGQRYLDGARWRARGRPFFTDKLPSNFLNLGFIARALPQAKILHMVRDPLDTCLSNLRELFSDACAYSYDQIELADYYREYRQLMAHWHAVLPGRILDVSYDDLVQDSAASAQRVMAFCGLAFEPDALAIERRSGAVATASSPQIHQGIHRRGLAAWHRYEAYLAPLRERLGELGLPES